jgi:hypothetical protein
MRLARFLLFCGCSTILGTLVFVVASCTVSR